MPTCDSFTGNCFATTTTGSHYWQRITDCSWEATRSAFEQFARFARFLQFYCCICCRYRRRSNAVGIIDIENIASINDNEDYKILCAKKQKLQQRLSQQEQEKQHPQQQQQHQHQQRHLGKSSTENIEISKYSQSNGSSKESMTMKSNTKATTETTEIEDITPTESAESINYSLKSTVSMQSLKTAQSNEDEAMTTTTKNDREPQQKSIISDEIITKHVENNNEENKCSTPKTTLEDTLQGNEVADNEVGNESLTKRSTNANDYKKATEEENKEQNDNEKYREAYENLDLEDIIDLTVETADLIPTIEHFHNENIPTDKPMDHSQSHSRRRSRSRSVSPISLLSRTESIKTQLEGTPPVLSRCQSSKSILIEEEIELSMNNMIIDPQDKRRKDNTYDDNNNYDNNDAVNADGKSEEAIEEAMKPTDYEVTPKEVNEAEKERYRDDHEISPVTAFDTPPHINTCSVIEEKITPRNSRSPTIAELKTISRRNSIMKSMESLYERPSTTKYHEDLLDNTIESVSTSSSASRSTSTSCSTLNQQLKREETYRNITPQQYPQQHTPFKPKSKTNHFLKTINTTPITSHNNNKRRISPARKRVVMTVAQPELFPQTMARFERPREALLKSFDQLDSSNWEMNVMGLKTMVRLMRYHPETLDSNMHMVCIQLTKAVRNLRSQVARAACQAATEIFNIKSKILEQECDDLVCGLLHRTADTNRFLRADASRALESMCDQITPGKILNVLTAKGATHQHALVRTTTAKLLNRLVERLGYERIYTNLSREQRDKFFITSANLLLEGSLETRGYAKSIFRQLSKHASYNRLLVEVIPTRTYRNVEKTLKSIR